MRETMRTGRPKGKAAAGRANDRPLPVIKVSKGTLTSQASQALQPLQASSAAAAAAQKPSNFSSVPQPKPYRQQRKGGEIRRLQTTLRKQDPENHILTERAQVRQALKARPPPIIVPSSKPFIQHTLSQPPATMASAGTGPATVEKCLERAGFYIDYSPPTANTRVPKQPLTQRVKDGIREFKQQHAGDGQAIVAAVKGVVSKAKSIKLKSPITPSVKSIVRSVTPHVSGSNLKGVFGKAGSVFKKDKSKSKVKIGAPTNFSQGVSDLKQYRIQQLKILIIKQAEAMDRMETYQRADQLLTANATGHGDVGLGISFPGNTAATTDLPMAQENEQTKEQPINDGSMSAGTTWTQVMNGCQTQRPSVPLAAVSLADSAYGASGNSDEDPADELYEDTYGAQLGSRPYALNARPSTPSSVYSVATNAARRCTLLFEDGRENTNSVVLDYTDCVVTGNNGEERDSVERNTVFYHAEFEFINAYAGN